MASTRAGLAIGPWRKMRWLTILLAMSLPLLLVACEVEGTARIAASDIVDALGGKQVTETMDLRVYATISRDNAGNVAQQIASALSSAFSEVKYVGFQESQGMENILLFRTTIPIVNYADKAASTTIQSPITLAVGEKDGKVGLVVVSLPQKIAAVRSAMVGQNPMARIENKDITFSVSLENDLRAPITFAPGNVFLAGQPATADDPPVTINRHDTIEIQLTNLQDALLLKRSDRSAFAGWIVLPK
jgi:hypothetical protein